MVDTPTLQDMERRLKNDEHDMEELAADQSIVDLDSIKNALMRVREAIGHVQKAQAKQKAQGE